MISPKTYKESLPYAMLKVSAMMVGLLLGNIIFVCLTPNPSDTQLVIATGCCVSIVFWAVMWKLCMYLIFGRKK